MEDDGIIRISKRNSTVSQNPAVVGTRRYRSGEIPTSLSESTRNVLWSLKERGGMFIAQDALQAPTAELLWPGHWFIRCWEWGCNFFDKVTYYSLSDCLTSLELMWEQVQPSVMIDVSEIKAWCYFLHLVWMWPSTVTSFNKTKH